MSFLSWFHVKPKADLKEAAPTAVICKCPNCGHGVLTLFTATEGRLKLVREAQGAVTSEVGVEEKPVNGVTPERILRERREKAEGRKNSRLYDTDHRPEPGV